MNLVLFGPPGAGKGTQSQLICERFHLTHLSTGDCIRAAIRSSTPLGIAAKTLVERGELIPDDLVSQLVEDVISKNRQTSDSFLFDGYPRTISQIGQLESFCEQYNLTAPVIVALDVPESVLMLRITGRRICLECKKTFNIYMQHPMDEGCDVHQCPLLQRADDKPETVRERLRVYHRQTEPVLLHYEMQGRLARINGSGATEEVFERIHAILSETY